MNAPFTAPKRVLLALGSLEGGGAERVALNLVHGCDARRLDLSLALLRRDGAYLSDIDPRRIVGPVHRGRGLLDALRAPRDLARMIADARPEVVMSFGLGVNLAVWVALAASPGLRPYWICREDSNIWAEIDNLTASGPIRSLLRALVRRIHRRADCVLAVAEDLGGRLARETPGATTRVIHNPIDLDAIAAAARRSPPETPTRPFIVAAGRLVRQKGFDLLIDAYASCLEAREFELVILGEGPLEADLKRRAQALGVGAVVRFVGFQANPWAWFARARLFVLPSRWEGFGNVVAEAMACGAPVLVSDCDFGPREQVVHGVSGWVAQPDALAAAMSRLLSDDALCERLANAGRARAQDFAVPAVIEAYDRLFLGRPAAEPAPAHQPSPVAAIS